MNETGWPSSPATYVLATLGVMVLAWGTWMFFETVAYVWRRLRKSGPRMYLCNAENCAGHTAPGGCRS